MQRDFVSESRDAASGGVTTMITTTLFGSGSRGEVAEQAIKAGNEHSLVDYRLTAVITTREQLDEAADLVKLGLRSFKFFLGYKGAQAESFGMNVDGISWDFFYQACEALGAAGAKAFPTIHAEDPYVRDFLTERLRGTGANRQLQTWLESSPNILEPMQIYPAALISHEVGTPVYVVHTSAWQSVDLIRDLKGKGWDVFGETLAAFLYWTAPEADAKSKGAVGKIQPPIRLDRDRDALWAGVLDGTITSIGTDCQMYPRETRSGDFWDTQVGLGPGMGTLLPAVHTAGVLTGRCTIEDVARLLSENTARRFDLYPRKGVLQPWLGCRCRRVRPGCAASRIGGRAVHRGRLLALRRRDADRLAGPGLRPRESRCGQRKDRGDLARWTPCTERLTGAREPRGPVSASLDEPGSRHVDSGRPRAVARCTVCGESDCRRLHRGRTAHSARIRIDGGRGWRDRVSHLCRRGDHLGRRGTIH